MELPCYIHYGKTTFDTGLKMELLQEYCLIALDEFQNYPYPKDKNEQTAWLSLLATENVDDADKLIKEYPWLEQIYREAASLRRNPEEVLGMYSEALRILDRNTVHYMIEEQKKEIEQSKREIEQNKKELEQSQNTIQEQEQRLLEQDATIEALKRQLEQLQQGNR